ncbi:unnamed protein product [Rotaria magnacalcarata]|uniref:Flavin-containing monooxygenase n=4 Tax=Rotaria magnacalcarata TaxID=392030 RepID=A0A815TPV7_9BILA|nr:unnamed protein product [Rotaria magnacalcarata]
MSSSKTVAIIGAGACGLVCAKVLLDDGFDVTLFERNEELGGIWSSKVAYADLHSQQPGGTFEFSDLYDGEEFTTWQHVHDYLQEYADLFHITERIQFQTQVLSVSKDNLKDDTIPWSVEIETISGTEETKKFDFVIVATGLFAKPFTPIYHGQSKFAGSILSPIDIKSHKQLADKSVLIVGCGKSAADMAVLAGKYARSCYLVFRKAHWMAPRTILGGLLPLRLLLTRAMSIPFTPVPGAPHSALFRYLHQTFPKVFAKVTTGIGDDIISTNGPDLYNDKIFIPQYPYRNLKTIVIIPSDFIRLKSEGRIIGRLGIIDEIIDRTTVRLNTGEELQVDMIISATGYIRQFPFFSEEHAQMMNLIESNGNIELNLYRRAIPVGIPNIAFIGFTGSINYWMVAEVASHWISDYFLNRLRLPSSEEKMYDEIRTNRDFIRKMFRQEEHEFRYYWAAPMEIYMNDMGLALHRTNNWISEYFGVYRPDRLKGLHEERKIIAQTGHRPRRFYFSFQLNMLLIMLLMLLYLIL